MEKATLKHGQIMYLLGLTYAIAIIRIYGDKALQELEQKVEQEQAVLDEMEKK